MARIAGIELQDNWTALYALTKIKGIGMSLSKEILKEVKIDEGKRVSDLSTDDLAKITSALDKYPTEGELIKNVKGNITRLQRIGTYRGIRHSRSLPSRGQRTRSNARSRRGKRKTVGAFKKEALSKMQQTQKDKKSEE